ncbi:universal stress protein [Lactiplantibacillus mudanjiangensis]|uniref:Universal stress protein UspA [Lactobacillus sp.] n=1 Tax=Lactiplantibacillus mudanjiangensis TaxID=1296538 RepID=A0A660E3S8_9LACO|nr:universal stress protein [Lactiplantibacillus mudanjiangensis]VDG18850.1 universal stress protein UspA [Lactobacillus sp.] [Lactiplantibacillus mudanjiangensis]VDG25371.1 universal stress protein UspA [Lactobacillus sp.] [Lactiplantibacillus mudanjiangensis]VDG27598.1 universal stress protein UspA [Lactobacillus sp.] [Lactiplantibacillus mudanjiangensis]VDG32949.1 universal stress protein UspA [Lactobacillus sp.] [Lactiplantibacillus mudanjiangensis]
MLQEYTKILVPMDGSKQAETALTKAVEVAKRNEAHIDVLSVIDPGQFGYNLAGLADGDITYQLVQDSEAYLQKKVAEIKAQGFDDIEFHIRMGSPKPIISQDFVQDHNNDLIMMGSTGLNAMERVLEGSVTTYVQRNALTDVIVVKTDLNNTLLEK